MNEGDRILMTELLAQLKQAEQDRDQAQKDMDTWIARMELAKKARDRDLWEGARARALDAEEKRRQAESVIMELEVQRDDLRRKARAPQADPGLAHANHLLEQFKELGVDPNEEKFQRMEKQAQADDALSALKRKMNPS
jgi:phage shock protein A